jgi:Asp-tRNA(Asn)/Glu-tRNA(Gln) amidotransferase C subunit
MIDLTNDEVRSLGKAAGIELQEPHLTEVTYNLNALRELLDQIDPEELAGIEPLPIIHPYELEEMLDPDNG